MNAVGHAPEFVVIVGCAVAALALARQARRLRRLGVAARGRAPVAPVLVGVGKLAAVVPNVVLAVAVRSALALPEPGHPLRRTVAVLLFVAGTAVLAVALAALGTSTRVGLPREETKLRTGAVYRFSRNPMYLALMLTHLGAIAYAPGPWTIGPALVSFLIHHRIVLAEEKFLAGRFGDSYAAYRRVVRRYL